jgi:hypothetical protein
MTKHLVIFTLVFGLASVAAAAGRAVPFTDIYRQYHSIRAAGMGGAFAAVANDEGAIFYNPAAFARFSEGKMQGTMFDIQGTPTIGDFFGGFVNAIASGNPVTLGTFLQNQANKNYSVRAKLFEMSWVRPKWGFSIIPADMSANIVFDSAIFDDPALPGAPGPADSPPFSIRNIMDTTVAFSYGTTIPNQSFGLFNIGMTLKGILRQYGDKYIRTDDVPPFNSSDWTHGITTDVDLGMLFTPYLPEGPAWNWLRASRPTFALVGRNLLDSGFTQKAWAGTFVYQPPKLNRVYDFGMRFEIPKFLIFGGRFAIDQRDFGHPNYSSTRGLHAGFEFDWSVTNWWQGQWRAGLSNGAPTFGFSALFSVFRLDLAMFSEDVGTVATPRLNQIYEFKMSGEF